MSSSPNIASIPKTVPLSASGVISLDDIESPVVRRGLDYWRALKGDRTYPSRADMQPRDLAPLLRNVVLLKVVDGGRDYEYRIVGDAHVISHGFSTQGRCVSDVDKFSPGYGAVLKSLYDRVLRKREVFAFRGWLERVVRGKPFIYCESVFMPMGPDEATVDHVLNFSVYSPRDSFEG